MQHDLLVKYEGISEQEFVSRTDSRISILSGTNNSGKSLILKHLFEGFGTSAYYCGANRYYELEHFPIYNEDPSFDQTTFNNVRAQLKESRFNRDPALMTFHDVFIRLTDNERKSVYKTCTDCLGEDVKLDFVFPGNSMSNSFLKIGNTPIAKCSSGSRMLVYLVSILFSKRFKHVLIDEPELGLTPRIQDAIRHLMFYETDNLFRHITHLYIATHSHIFLNRNRINDNFVVTRNDKSISVKRVSTYQEFVDLQFNQLGNSFHQLQLPSGFVIVEGTTDYDYIKRILHLKIPNNRINLTAANGDGEVKKKLYDLLEVIGPLNTSPYNDRVFVVLDSKHAPSLKTDLVKKGLPSEGVIAWKKNGIEFYYPESILRSIFKDEALQIEDLHIENDRISHNGIEKTKRELCDDVVDRLSESEVLHQELNDFVNSLKSF